MGVLDLDREPDRAVQRLQRAVELRLPWHCIDLMYDRRSQLVELMRSTVQRDCRNHVRFGSKADIQLGEQNVR
jgi:hypothetical protein